MYKLIYDLRQIFFYNVAKFKKIDNEKSDFQKNSLLLLS